MAFKRIVTALSILLLAVACQIVGPAPEVPSAAALKGDALEVRKATREMDLIDQGRVVKTYRIALGANPIGHKQRAGDQRTPEGFYAIDYRNPRSQFHKSMHISYPNAADRSSAEHRGDNPGGTVMIHGTGKLPASVRENDWTDGCIAVTNREIDELWAALPKDRPVPILIRP
jgi:murein L,D-transpeptidase YafK